jgi:hypothetical protein
VLLSGVLQSAEAKLDGGVWLEDLAGAPVDEVFLPVGATVDLAAMTLTPELPSGSSVTLSVIAQQSNCVRCILNSVQGPLIIACVPEPPVDRSLWFNSMGGRLVEAWARCWFGRCSPSQGSWPRVSGAWASWSMPSQQRSRATSGSGS